MTRHLGGAPENRDKGQLLHPHGEPVGMEPDILQMMRPPRRPNSPEPDQ